MTSTYAISCHSAWLCISSSTNPISAFEIHGRVYVWQCTQFCQQKIMFICNMQNTVICDMVFSLPIPAYPLPPHQSCLASHGRLSSTDCLFGSAPVFTFPPPGIHCIYIFSKVWHQKLKENSYLYTVSDHEQQHHQQ